jgi:hypothetical protein
MQMSIVWTIVCMPVVCLVHLHTLAITGVVTAGQVPAGTVVSQACLYSLHTRGPMMLVKVCSTAGLGTGISYSVLLVAMLFVIVVLLLLPTA